MSDFIGHIFVVVDASTSTLTTTLRVNGFSARFFTTPMQAFAAARLHRADLLISDAAVSDLSGVDLAIAMSARLPDKKSLLVSRQQVHTNSLRPWTT